MKLRGKILNKLSVVHYSNRVNMSQILDKNSKEKVVSLLSVNIAEKVIGQ